MKEQDQVSATGERYQSQGSSVQVDFCEGFGELEDTPGSAAVLSQNAASVTPCDEALALRNSSGRVIREGNEDWMR